MSKPMNVGRLLVKVDQLSLIGRSPDIRKKELTDMKTGYTLMSAIHKGQIVESVFARPSVISRIILSEGSSVDARRVF